MTNGNDEADWAVLKSAFDLAPVQWGLPVAVQVILNNGNRTVSSGIVTGTEDQYASVDNTLPHRSYVFFRGTEGIRIEWAEVAEVLAMIAVPDYPEPEEGEGSE